MVLHSKIFGLSLKLVVVIGVVIFYRPPTAKEVCANQPNNQPTNLNYKLSLSNNRILYSSIQIYIEYVGMYTFIHIWINWFYLKFFISVYSFIAIVWVSLLSAQTNWLADRVGEVVTNKNSCYPIR